jgi:hypothetical protein
MKSKPGLYGKPFYLKFDQEWVRRGDILETSDNYKLKVLKVYKFTWWKKILFRLGFRFKSMEVGLIKAKSIKP